MLHHAIFHFIIFFLWDAIEDRTTGNVRHPGAEPCDFARFFGALAQARYAGRISIEGKIKKPEKDLPAALSSCASYSFDKLLKKSKNDDVP